MRRIRALALGLMLSGCGPVTDVTGAGDPNHPGGTGTGGGGDTVTDPTAGPNCGTMQFSADRVPANVLLALDRSGSMSDPIDTQSTASKWDDLKSALHTVVPQYDAQVRFGLQLFPDPNGAICSAGTVQLSCNPSSGSQVLSRIDATEPGGNTPTAVSVQQLISGGALSDPTRQNFLVLATDGLPNCGDTDVAARIAQLYNATPSVRTFVIGVGAEVNGDPQLLSSWAVAGHTERAGGTAYYSVSSPADLQAAFNEIAAGVAQCSYVLSAAPPDPTQLYVYFNTTGVPLDAMAGYTYDAASKSVTFHGASCDYLRQNAGMVKVQIVYGCPTPPIS